MALKNTVTSIEEVPEALREHYVPVKEGEAVTHYALAVDGAEDVGALKRALDRVRTEAKDAIALAKQKGEDITALEASWNDRLRAKETELTEHTKNIQAALKRTTKDRTVNEIATRLFGESAFLVAPVLEKRIKVELDGDRAIERVLDAEGRPSAFSLSDLEKELREDARYAKILIATKASGSGAGRERTANGQGGAPNEGAINPNKLKPAELVAWLASQREKRGG